MKTVHYNTTADLVVNVSMGEPSGNPPAGIEYIVVPEDTYVGPGCKRAADGTFYMPTPDPAED